MADDALWGNGGVDPPQSLDDLHQVLVLEVGVGNRVAALQLDTDGKIITSFAPGESGISGMPGAPVERYELDYFAVAADQEVGRYLEALDHLEVRMVVWIQAIGKQGFNPGTAELAWRQADAVDDDEIY